MNVHIRLMTDADIDDIVEISSLSFSHSWSKSSYEHELQNSLAKYFVAEINNKVVGFIGTWIIVDESHITNVAVHPDFRKNGIALKLINTMIAYCKDRGCIAYTLEVRAGNIPAILLYEKCGFKQDGIRKGYYQDNNEDAILMWLR
ncbi:MAG: ribosomal-protein-alanine N-acetyltransferase [Clostridium butyricum]|nr:ribosomal-protein-alanine N-acetyltransferase [Clostridium butyricum]